MTLNSEVTPRDVNRLFTHTPTAAKCLYRILLSLAVLLSACAQQDAPNEVRSHTNDVVSATIINSRPRATTIGVFGGTAAAGLQQMSAMTLPGSGVKSLTDCVICDSVPDGGGGGGGGGTQQPTEPDPMSYGLTPLEAAALQEQGVNPYAELPAPSEYLANIIARLPRHAPRYAGANPTGTTEVERQYLPSASGARSYLSTWTDSLGRVKSVYVVAPDGGILLTNDFKWSATDSLLSYALYTNYSTTAGSAIIIAFSNDGLAVAHGRASRRDGTVEGALRMSTALAAGLDPRMAKFGQRCAQLAADVLLPTRANAQYAIDPCVSLTATAAFTILGAGADIYLSYMTPPGQALCMIYMNACAAKTVSIVGLMGISVLSTIECWSAKNAQRGALAPIQNKQTTTRQNAPSVYIGGYISAPRLWHSSSYFSNLGWLTEIGIQRPDNSTVTAGNLINQEFAGSVVTFGDPASVYLSASSGSIPPIFDAVMARLMLGLPPRY